jgi:hypothetical protein
VDAGSRLRRAPAGAGGADDLVRLAEEKLRAVEEYARVNPVHFGLWMFGIGFVLGWKLKPW